MSKNKSTVNPMRKKAFGLLHKQQYREAGMCFAQLAKQAPGDAEAWLMQGVCLQRLGRVEQGIPLLEKAVSLNPQSAKAPYLLGLA